MKSHFVLRSTTFSLVWSILVLLNSPRITEGFNLSDGQTDIVWHYDTGVWNYAWFINGVIYQDENTDLGASYPSSWILVGTGDFDRNGETDLLFRNSQNGDMAVWYWANGAFYSAAMLGVVGDLNYYVVGTGDFDEDGVIDILWHHNSNIGHPAPVVWYMNTAGNFTYSFSGNIEWGVGNFDPDWYAVATGDVNNDNKCDIYWRKSTTSGINAVWLMDGVSTKIGEHAIQSLATNFKLASTGQFNREGHTDLIWRDLSTGINGFWLMGGDDGATMQGDYFGTTFLPTVTDQNWRVAGVGGYTNEMALSAAIDPQGGKITLNWKPGKTTRTTVDRKLIGEDWGTPIVSDYYPYSYESTGVASNTRYEFNVGGSYIVSAIAEEPVENRGKAILVVEASIKNALESEIDAFKKSLVGDGWIVPNYIVSSDVHDENNSQANIQPIEDIKSAIFAEYNASITNVVIIIGHVPIPYSGTYADDGHVGQIGSRDHQGAWTSDAYYGNSRPKVDWGDVRVQINDDHPQNTNLANDGKLDLDYLPIGSSGTPLQIAVARIDFAKLPAFTSQTEVDLTRQYFVKNASFRANSLSLNKRACVGGFFAVPPPFNTKAYQHINDQTFSNARGNATRWFGIGPGKLFHGDIFAQTSTTSLIGFMGGDGEINHQIGDAAAVHTTELLANPANEPKTAFYVLNGSWFADWNLNNNNFLRACLATPNYGLAVLGASNNNAAIRYRMESMGLGDPLAYSMLRTCAELGVNKVPRWLTILGDPTLRLEYPTPVPSLTATSTAPSGTATVNLSWGAAQGAENYYLYRSMNDLAGPWERIFITGGLSYGDTNPPDGAKMYMVRAQQLTETECGSYKNLAQGVFAVPILAQ